jgi:predicted AlkP superfamily phosphohydrolase/phosphomutase
VNNLYDNGCKAERRGGTTTRVALVGLDGIPWRVLVAYHKHFKNTLQLAATGKSGINWCVPPYTPPSWTSISTGVDAKKHKIFGFTIPDFAKSHRNVYLSSYDVQCPRLPELLAMSGLKSLVFNHVLSYPARGWYLKNQAIVGDTWAPKQFVYPRNLEWCRKFFETKSSFRPSSLNDKWLVDQAEMTSNKVEGMLKLIEATNPDFVWAVFEEPDRVMHRLGYVAAGVRNEGVGQVFSMIDSFIGEVAREFDYVVIVSDHGFDIYRRGINLWGLLSRHGVIDPSEGILGVLSTFLSSRVSGFLTERALSSDFAFKAFARVRRIARDSLARDAIEVSQLIRTDSVSPDNAFMLYFRDDRACYEVASILSLYVGELFERVEKIDLKVPALLVVPRWGLHFLNDPLLRRLALVEFAEAKHSCAGVFILNGRKLDPQFTNVKNTDIAPTILSAFRVAQANHFDGHSLLNSGTRGSLSYINRWRLLRKMS